MERQNRILSALSLALLILVAGLVLDWERSGEEMKQDDDAPSSHDLFSFKAEDVSSLELVRAGSSIKFERKDGAWAMVAPVSTLADNSAVEAIVDRMEELRMEDRELTGAAADYGLDEANRTEVRATTADGKLHTLFVGADTKVGYKSYGQSSASDKAHLLSYQIGSLVTKGPDEFRGRQLLQFAAGGARRVRIVQGTNETVLRKDDTGWWIGDTGPRADAKRIADWLSSVSLMKVASFLDGQTPSALGLDSPAATVSVEDDGGTRTLKIGVRDADGAPGSAGDVPVRISVEDLDKLLPSDSWASTTLVDVQSWKVEGLDVKLGDKALSATRKDGAWRDSADAEVAGADDLIDALNDAAVDRTAADLSFAGDWGQVKINLGKSSVVVKIGNELAGGARVAKDEAGGPPFSIPAATLELLAAKLP